MPPRGGGRSFSNPPPPPIAPPPPTHTQSITDHNGSDTRPKRRSSNFSPKAHSGLRKPKGPPRGSPPSPCPLASVPSWPGPRSLATPPGEGRGGVWILFPGGCAAPERGHFGPVFADGHGVMNEKEVCFPLQMPDCCLNAVSAPRTVLPLFLGAVVYHKGHTP